MGVSNTLLLWILKLWRCQKCRQHRAQTVASVVRGQRHTPCCHTRDATVLSSILLLHRILWRLSPASFP